MSTAACAASSSSVHPLETIGEWLQVTQGQLKLFGPDMAERENILVAFGMSGHPGLIRRGSNIAFCCRSPFIYADSSNKPVLSLQTCKDRMCPRCQRARAQKVVRKVEALVMGYNAPRFLTLTLKHREAESLKDMLNRLAHAFRTLRASPFWRRNVTRGVYTVEVTWNREKREWHAHLHSIIDGDFMKQSELVKLWKEITLDSTIVHIEAVHDRARQARYISKYVAKPCDGASWHEEQLCEFAQATHGRRMVHTFGKSHGKPVEAERTDDKPKISSPLLSLRALCVEASRECPIALRACSLLSRMGTRWCLAAGFEPPPIDAKEEKVTDAELQSFVADCTLVAAQIQARENPQAPKVEADQVKKSARADSLLFPLHHGAGRAKCEEIEIPV